MIGRTMLSVGVSPTPVFPPGESVRLPTPRSFGNLLRSRRNCSSWLYVPESSMLMGTCVNDVFRYAIAFARAELAADCAGAPRPGAAVAFPAAGAGDAPFAAAIWFDSAFCTCAPAAFAALWMTGLLCTAAGTPLLPGAGVAFGFGTGVATGVTDVISRPSLRAWSSICLRYEGM